MSAEEHLEKALFEKYASECDSRVDRIRLCKAYLDKYVQKSTLPFTQYTPENTLNPVFDKRIVKSETLNIEHFQSGFGIHHKEGAQIARDIQHGFASMLTEWVVMKSWKDMDRAGTVHRFTLGVWK